MSRAIVLAQHAAPSVGEALRVLIVLSCALALIMAEAALPSL
ncbi:hypothetical protein [Novosphingobium sp. Chol11]|nr:hypothetical protein [Novosphingobium sp. Chol11]